MSSIIIMLLIVLYKIPFINILGDKGIGYFSIALTIYLLIMTFISYGIPKSVSSIITEQNSKGQYALIYQTCMRSLIFAMLVGAAASLLIFLGADIFAVHLMNAEQSSYAIRAIAPCLLFSSFLSVLHGIFKGTKAKALSVRIHFIEVIFCIILSVLGAFWVKSNVDIVQDTALCSAGASLGITCGLFISCFIAIVYFLQHRKKLKRMAKRDIQDIQISKKQLFILLINNTIPFILTLVVYHLSNLLDYAVFDRIMSVQGHKESSYIILLGMLNGKYEFFITIPLLIVSWYAVNKTSHLKNAIQQNNERKLFNKINNTLRFIMLYIIPCTLFYIFYAEPLMNLLFGGINDTPAMLLRVGAVSIVFYSVAVISNTILNVSGNWKDIVKNSIIALIIQIICLMIMMIIFQWTIPAVVISRILFAASLFVLNEHTLREETGYIPDIKRCFKLPFISSLIMSVISFIVYFIFNLFIEDKIAVLIAFAIAIPAYILALVFTGGITQREMYRLPGGKILAPLCKKLHLTK